MYLNSLEKRAFIFAALVFILWVVLMLVGIIKYG